MVNGINSCINFRELQRQPPKMLPIIKLGNIKYFVDERLNELRDVNNPHNVEKMEGSANFYLQHFRIKEV